jgi:hypothetical protein
MAEFDQELNENKDLAKRLSTYKFKEVLRESILEY